MTYNVEISGLVYVEADSKEEAIEKIKDKFYDDLLSIDDLWLDCEEVEEDEFE